MKKPGRARRREERRDGMPKLSTGAPPMRPETHVMLVRTATDADPERACAWVKKQPWLGVLQRNQMSIPLKNPRHELVVASE